MVATFEWRNSGEACKTGMIPVEKVMIVVVDSEMREFKSVEVDAEGMK